MTVSSVPRIQINGAIDTSQTVMANINNIATNSQSWVTWDTTIAKWRIIANAPAPTNTAYNFDNSTIIGGISVTGTPLEKMYNAAEITFNNDELRDDTDSIGIRLPENQRYPNESENAVNLNYTLINNPVHAQILGSIELLQSRLDKIITFTTDFSSSGLTAGEVIRVNAPIYGYSNKLFRVTSIEESDEDNGGILFRITAVEYDSSVYSGSFTRDARTKATDIIPFELNNCVQQSINEDLQERVGANVEKDCWCILVDFYDLGTLNITADTNGLYTQSNQDFFRAEIYADLDGVPVLQGYSLTDFDPNNAQYRYDTGIVFTAPKTGSYTFYNIINVAENRGGPTLGPERSRYKAAMHIIKSGVRSSPDNGVSFTEYQFSSSKFDVPFNLFLNEGESFEFVVRVKTDYGPSHPEVDDSYEVAWTAYTQVFYSPSEELNWNLFSAAP